MAKYTITDKESLRLALDEVKAQFMKAGLDGVCLFHSKLVFSELASNVVRHTEKGGEIQVEVRTERVEFTLTGEASMSMPQTSQCSPATAESGRGLFLIDSVCDSRENTDDGVKIVLIRKNG